MSFSKSIRRLAKKVARRAPKPVKRLAKRLVWIAAPSEQGRTARMRAHEGSDTAQLLGVTPELIGDTYHPDEVLPMLALENEILRRRLFEALDKLEHMQVLEGSVATHATPETVGAAAPTTDSESVEPGELARSYLAGQPRRPGARRHLVVANDYPDVGREYGNGFIHRRVVRYLKAGIDVDVVLVGPSQHQRIYEWDGVRVVAGDGRELDAVLAEETYTSVSAHFLNEMMWDNLEPHLAHIDLHVFLHGYECDRWVRRMFNFDSGTALERGIDRTIRLQRFWEKVLDHPHQPSSYVFVSKWWQRAVTDDMNVVFPAVRTQIVHNLIDTEFFDYVEKDASQRFKILWVRSADSRKYGHDIAIDILRRLARTRHWSQVEVTIIGDGRYFSEFEDALGRHPNVSIQRRFASQDEIRDLHKEHGIFLVPSRLDSQGVSRDEAMSSGLVPVTNLVTAIPEFVDASSGIVAGPGSAERLADGIARVMGDPALFSRLSAAASQRAAAQCGSDATVDRELSIMGLRGFGEKEDDR